MSRLARLRCTLRAVSALMLSACAGRAAAPASAAPPPGATAPDDSLALTAHRDWWEAFAIGDTTALTSRSDPALVLTMSDARRLDLDGAIVDAASRTDAPPVRLAWSEERVARRGTTAIVASRATERVGATVVSNRFLTVLLRHEGGWRVAAAQSTRITPPTPLASVPRSVLAQYAGRYQAPARVIEVVLRDSSIAVVAGGPAERLRPIGLSVFELGDGQTRMIFERDSTGRVSGVTRTAPGVVRTFPRLP